MPKLLDKARAEPEGISTLEPQAPHPGVLKGMPVPPVHCMSQCFWVCSKITPAWAWSSKWPQDVKRATAIVYMYTMERNCLRKAVFLYGIFWFDIFNSVTATKLCVVFGLKMMTFTQIPAALEPRGGWIHPWKGQGEASCLTALPPWKWWRVQHSDN
jgi:hypothetical protein